MRSPLNQTGTLGPMGIRPFAPDRGKALLDYALITNASPLNVGSPATLTFVVSAPKEAGDIRVSRIAFTLPVGNPDAPDAADLTEQAPPASAVSILSSGSASWTIVPGQADGVFVATPDAGPVDLGSQGLTVMFTGIAISPLVGTSAIEILEWASGNDTPAPRPEEPPRSTTVRVSKFPAGFFAGNLSATPPQVANSGSTNLTWIGSAGATYRIFCGGNPPVDVSDVRSWASPPLADTTSFVLEASAEQGGQMVFLYFQLTVVVSEPSVIAKDLSVLTASTLNGAVTVGTETAPADLTVQGGVSASAEASVGSLNVSGNTAVGGDLSVTGAAALKAGANVSGDLSLSGSLTASGEISAGAITAAAPFKLGAWTLSIDGSGNLIFAHPDGGGFILGSKSGMNLASGPMQVNSQQVITDRTTVWITNDQGVLNGSGKLGSGAGIDGYSAGTFWQNAPPDGDSTLQIRTSPPT